MLVKIGGDKYHSLHEGYAVLLEEVEEVQEDIKMVTMLMSGHHLWGAIKNNGSSGYTVEQMINSIEEETLHAMKELAQVGAVLQKIKNTLEQTND